LFLAGDVTVEVSLRQRNMETIQPADPASLAVPPELLPTVGRSIDVAVIYDLDYLSHAGRGGTRIDDATLAALTGTIEVAASACGRLCYVRAACSATTAFAHRLALVGAANNSWQAVAGRHGADTCVVAELDNLVRAPRMRLVVLIAGGRAYADPVLALRDVGVAVWVLYRSGSLSWRLYQAATSATPLPAVPVPVAVAACSGERRSRVAALPGAGPNGAPA
jgi:hypothetical protein